MKTNFVIIKPVLTEKASQLVKEQVYTFEVHEDANKHKVTDILEKIYKVKVGSVRISNRKGKTKRVGRTMKDKKLSDTKIAYVTLISGKIDLYPQT